MIDTTTVEEPTTPDDRSVGVVGELEADLRDLLPEAWISAVVDGNGAELERQASGPGADRIVAAVASNGWLTPDWPVRYGGRDCSPGDAAAVKRALRRWSIGDVRTAIGTSWVGPTILQWGTVGQRERWLPQIAAARELWCQLFSEPDAGSDLASLRTMATQSTSGVWSVTGTKMWTSRAHISRRGLLICRTDPAVPKHRGLTAFALDLELPGVTVRPIRQMTGDAEFFEVHLDDVEITDRDRIGEPGDGWSVCRTALSFERIAGSGAGASPPGSVVGRPIEDLIAHRRDESIGSDRMTERDRLVREWISGRLIELLNLRVAATRAAGRPVGPEGSVTKVLQAEHTKRLQRLFVDSAGMSGVAWEVSDGWAADNAWAFLRVQAKTIAGGTSEVLRNQLAERVLGLPREQDPSRILAWNKLMGSPHPPSNGSPG